MQNYKLTTLLSIFPLLFISAPVTLVFAQVSSPVAITTTSLPSVSIGEPVSITISASGGVAPYTWSATGLPTGVSIDPASGVISGVPATSDGIALSITTFNPVIQVQDFEGQASSVTFNWNITGSGSMSYIASSTNGFVTGPVTFKIHGVWNTDFCTDTNSNQYRLVNALGYPDLWISGHTANFSFDDVWTAVLPPGHYGPSASVVCDGGLFPGSFGAGNRTLNFSSFTVPSFPEISSSSILPLGLAGQPYSTTLQLNAPVPAAPYLWSISAGALPIGLSLNSLSGVISGTPTTAGTSIFTVQVMDAAGQVNTVEFTLVVSGSAPTTPSIITTNLPTVALGEILSIPISAVDGIEPYTWSATGLPNGVSIDPSTGILSGVALARDQESPSVDMYTPTIQIHDSVGQTNSITLNWNITGSASMSYTASSTNGFVTGPVTFKIHGVWKTDFCTDVNYIQYRLVNMFEYPNVWFSDHTFGVPFDDVWTVTLGPGHYGPNNGVICDGGLPFGAFGSGNQTLHLDSFIVPSPPVISSDSALPSALVGQSYSNTLQLDVPVPAAPYIWSVASGVLPDGLSLDSSTGVLSGTATTEGMFNFVVRVTDASSQIATKTLSVEVMNNNRPPLLAPIGNQTVNEGQTFSTILSATDPDGDALTYSASNLPPGAAFDPTTRTFTWTPGYNQAGNYPNVEFTVTDNGSPMMLDFEDITITVGDVNRAPILTNPGPQQVLEHNTSTFNVSATDPDGDAVTLSATGLPFGASFNPTTGVFTWTPGYPTAGVYTPTFIATDNGTPTASSSIDVVITVGTNPTPTEQSQSLIDITVSYNVPTNTENSYLANLNKVGTFIEQGKTQQAINQLNAFIQKVDQDYAHGTISLAQKNALVVQAQMLIAALQ